LLRNENHYLEISSDLKDAAARAFATKLIDAGLAGEIRTIDGRPVWRHDKNTGHDYSLKLTPSGMKIALENADTIQADVDTRSNFKRSKPREHSKLS
jgi:hypothetical protein